MNAPVKTPIAAHKFERQPENWYVEPEWVSEALFAAEPFWWSVLDPACGGGNIIRSARLHGLKAFGSDIVARFDDPDFEIHDFLRGELHWNFSDRLRPDNIISNPPYGDDLIPFIERALELAICKVAMVLPLTFMTGSERQRWLETTPLYKIMPISPRPSMPPGEALLRGEKSTGGTKDFAWFIWLKGFQGQPTVQFCKKVVKQ